MFVPMDTLTVQIDDDHSDLRSEGDLNLSDARRRWQSEHLDRDTRALLDEDAAVFLHQSLSTPCLNVVESCEGPQFRQSLLAVCGGRLTP